MSVASIPFNTQVFNGGGWNGTSFTLEPALEIAVLFNTTLIALNWTSVPEATHYQVQVSLFPDFRTVFETAIKTGSEHSFTDSQINDEKRYWRWRPSIDGGATFFEPFSEVGSYWLNTAAANEIVLSRNTWRLVDPDDVTDIYTFVLFPQYTIVDQNLFRIQERNRLGELLSEFLTIKGDIRLNFSGDQYLEHQQLNELRRFHNIVRVVFIATFKDGERQRPMPHIWKTEFVRDPSFTMIAAGRQDLLQGQIAFQEV